MYSEYFLNVVLLAIDLHVLSSDVFIILTHVYKVSTRHKVHPSIIVYITQFQRALTPFDVCVPITRALHQR